VSRLIIGREVAVSREEADRGGRLVGYESTGKGVSGTRVERPEARRAS
jgi:hypothetical protein